MMFIRQQTYGFLFMLIYYWPYSNCFSIEYRVRSNVGHEVVQLVEALRYKSEGRGFDSRWCHWNFSLS